jgi:predicted transcriptional regulator of viral defense system
MGQKQDIIDYLSDGRVLTRQAVVEHGWSPGVITRLLTDGDGDERPATLERIGFGLARLSRLSLRDPLGNLAAVFGPRGGVLCLWTAARYHALTDVGTSLRADTVAVPASDRGRDHGTGVRVFRWSPRLLETGIEEVSTRCGRIGVTDAARTVVDMFRPEVDAAEGGPMEALAILLNRDREVQHAVSRYAADLAPRTEEHINRTMETMLGAKKWMTR